MKHSILKTSMGLLIGLNLSVLAQNKAVFNYTGNDQFYTVPAGVTCITVKAWGGGGAGGNYVFNDYGGGGGYATGVLKVTPGDVLKIIVGGGGQTGKGPGAYGGGGAKSGGYASFGGRGGGRSAVRNAADVELLTAGGGGGGGGVSHAKYTGAGGGGGLIGGFGNYGEFDGKPGTQNAGGAGGTNTHSHCACGSNAGSQFQGGEAQAIDNGYNGSGGGGYYGGGSGTDYGDGGGGGGSSFVPEGGCTVGAANFNAANNADKHYGGDAGLGGQKGQNGKNGRIVILPVGFFVHNDITPISNVGYCDGAISITGVAGQAPHTYLWSDGFSNATRNFICPGTYTITVTDALGCSKTINRTWKIEAEALNFNSPLFSYSNYINCGNAAALKIDNTITVEAWVKPAPGAHRIMGKYDNNLKSGWRLEQTGNHFSFGVSNGNNDHDLVSTVTYTNNQWYHVAASYDKANGLMSIYVDGVLTQETNYFNGALLNTSNEFWIGAYMAWGFNGFVGSLDEVRIWNTIRTASELSTNSSCQLNGNEPGLVAYYKFNQGDAGGNNAGVNKLHDSGPNELHGNLIGFALNGNISNWISPGAVNTNCGARVMNNDIAPDLSNSITVYPNPANDNIKIKLTDKLIKLFDINVFDQLGRNVLTKNKLTATDDLQLDVSTFSNGIYTIAIQTENNKYTERFVINR